MNKQQELSPMHKSIAESQKRQLEISIQKNADYSRGESQFRNFEIVSQVMPWISVEEGILVRILDKVTRVANLIHYGNAQVAEEKIEDTCDDAANYFNILTAYRAYKYGQNKNNKTEHMAAPQKQQANTESTESMGEITKDSQEKLDNLAAEIHVTNKRTNELLDKLPIRSAPVRLDSQPDW